MKKSFIVTVEDNDPELFNGADNTILNVLQDFTIFDAVTVTEVPNEKEV